MNLWARTLGQLAVLAVALFFFSCEDETSILGFKNPNQKFKVNYVDIPLSSDVFLLDSVRTSNFFGDDGESIRLLAGQYSDEEFGHVSATAITQFFTATASPLKETAVFDSVSLQLDFDFYTYGRDQATSQTISVHELEKELKLDSASYYFSKSNASYNPTALGTKTFTVRPQDFKKYLDDRKDTTITLHLSLDQDFGRRIFNSAIKYRDAATTADSTFVKLDLFTKEFKGIAIVSEQGDKIIGFDPSSSASRITLHYHDADADSLELNLSFANVVVGYNEIRSDRSSTELAGLNQYSQPFSPSSDNRYVQAGAGVLTRLDFQDFYDFVDADSNATVIVNSAELRLGTPASSPYDPINGLLLLALQNEAHVKKLLTKEDSTTVSAYAGQLGFTTSNRILTPMNPDGSLFTLKKSGSNEYYNGFLTLFVQELFKVREQQKRFRYFALYPSSPQVGKSVNRLIFDADNIRLRVYYTRPVPTQ